ncbi:hypothetical protein B0A48_17914 [Cryoendolithus antarcticus]|uniref:LAA1-like C-terminal TPR repeats domain-containing protein n=1 Tax=Cryoendolithus antarcticus TaxID=1507870 RepID=A0A1V8SAT7_9PEZI|nr:hypothetical protein B0A48_17914 [Cryoendolithus antarcticus]
MAEPEAGPEAPATIAPAPSNLPKTKSDWELDVTRLHSLPSEQQELYLLSFTAGLAAHVENLSADGATAEQTALKKELFQVINLSSPPPTRVIRNNVGRCFSAILTKGSRKILYESIHDCVDILNAPVKDKDLRAKHAATHCLGAVFEAAGDSAMSLSPLACTALLKQFKPAANDAGYRSAIYRALGKVVKGIVAAIDEELGRNIWKLARSAVAGEKSFLVQASACKSLEQLINHTTYFDNSNDFEKLQTALWKSMESASIALRRAAVSCLSAVLVKAHSESPNKEAMPRIRKPKKAKKKTPGEEADEEIERTSSPVPEKPATSLSLSLAEIMRTLSMQYMRSTTTHRARGAVINTYIRIFRSLGESVVEQHYGEIARHLFVDVLSHPGLTFNVYRQLASRRYVRVVLERVIGRMLGETAQLNASRFLLNEIIKDYPQAIKERAEPTKQTLTAAVSALTSLIQCLAAGAGTIAELCREGLLQVLQHPSFVVQIHAARALKALVLAVPQQLLPSVTICMNSVSRELNLLNTQRQSPKRCIGYAHGLSAVLSASIRHPLYGSVDVYARVLEQATNLLKSSSSSDLRISGCQLQVAWVMIGGLMSLGPNFVKIHLPQLMLLWKNALPKPLPNESTTKRSVFELSYLAHVRETALGSIEAFLTFNQRLLTLDTSRRLSAMLEHTVAFLQGLPQKKTTDDPSNRLRPSMQLQDYEVTVRRRVFRCFSLLLTRSSHGAIESASHSMMLPLAVASFSSTDYAAPNSLSASIAGSSGTFESIWETADNHGFGVSSLVCRLDVRDPASRDQARHWTSRSDDEAVVNDISMTPVIGAAEYDPAACYVDPDVDGVSLPVIADTETVNAAIAVFGLSLPLQTPKVQESVLEQVSASLSSSSLQKDPARKAAITVNIALALYLSLRVTTGDTGSTKGSLQSAQAEKVLQDILHVLIKDPDHSVRLLAADALGRLCSSSGSALTTNEVTHLIEIIVSNREPHVRAGCALALACIHARLGGMAAGYHMKNIVGILMSLAADSHPLVHFWALEALGRVAESAGLNFSAYVTSTLGMLSQLFVSDNHNSENATLASSNMSLDLPISAAIAHGVDALINVLGPALQDMTKSRDMILTLVGLFDVETEVETLLASLRCMEHLSVYAPGHLQTDDYVRRLQANIDSDSAELSHAAVSGMFSLMRRDAPEIISTAKPGLEERLWEYLNGQPDSPAVRNIFLNWLQQTGSSDPAEWIARCNTVLTKSKSRVEQPKTALPKNTPAPDVVDEEVAGFAVGEGAAKEDDSQTPTSTQELMRWQVRLFAMELLFTLIATISKEAAIREDTSGEAALQYKLADIVRIAFSASTASVAALRIVGLRIVEQILKMFGRTPDPDFAEAMLLEQYQAQISSALTPAFAADSSPELAAEAVDVCATFISTGIVTDIERMGRILKLLVSALESFSKDSETATIGDLRALSSNAQVMVRMAIFSAWAELQVASVEQKYLEVVVKPHIAQLVPLWLSSLREYARLRFEPDISAVMGPPGPNDDLDSVYAALNRQTLLAFYQDSWLSLVDAIASLVDEDSEFVFDALDNKNTVIKAEGTNGISRRKSAGINYHEEPVAFFFVLFGLAFESLAVRTAEDDIVTSQRNMDILQALKKILRPSVSGKAIYQDVVFSECMDLLDRMVLTESLGVQAIIVEIARNLCITHPSSRQSSEETQVNGEGLSDDIEQLFELTRIIVLVISGLVPGLSDNPVSVRLESSDEADALVRTSMQALVDVSEVFPSIIRTDLHATILHIFVTICGTGSCQAAVVPQTLPILRRFIVSIVADVQPKTHSQLINTLKRFQLILRNAQKRETEASLACEKNTLLACTVLISTAPDVFVNTNAAVNKFVEDLCECLESRMTSRVAAGCIRTLLMAQIAPRHFLTHALAFLSAPPKVEGLDESLTLVAQTLTAYVPRIPAEGRLPALVMVLSALLQGAEQGGPSLHQETAARILELATADNASFRTGINALSSPHRSLLERILKARAGAQVSQDTNGDTEPTIALKMNFGG